jgi:hypothetical protein
MAASLGSVGIGSAAGIEIVTIEVLIRVCTLASKNIWAAADKRVDREGHAGILKERRNGSLLPDDITASLKHGNVFRNIAGAGAVAIVVDLGGLYAVCQAVAQEDQLIRSSAFGERAGGHGEGIGHCEKGERDSENRMHFECSDGRLKNVLKDSR